MFSHSSGLVQRTIDTTANNCNANYSGFSRFPHGPVVNKFYCHASYVYYFWTCLGSIVARDILIGSQLSGGRHSPVTLDTMWSSGNSGDLALMIGLQQRRMNQPSRAWRMSTECNRRRSVATTFIEQSLAGDATII